MTTEEAERSTAEVRVWARQLGVIVPDRGRLRPDTWRAWRKAQPDLSKVTSRVGMATAGEARPPEALCRRLAIASAND